MTKPDWYSAPEWASYLAQDANGEWWWYSEPPQRDHEGWYAKGGIEKQAFASDEAWKYTLETHA